MQISFNSRGSSVLDSGQRVKAAAQDYRLLSNLYGDVEFNYMADRFQNEPVKALFTEPGSALRRPREFEENLRAIHPKGKPESWMRAPSGRDQRAEDAADETGIAMGILAKLCGSAYKDTTEGRRRRAYLISLAKMEDSDWQPMKGELTTYQKAELMLPLLRRKFTPPGPFRDTLEATGDAQLIERPMRGAPHLWEGAIRDGSVVGGNLCGRLLMHVRDTLDKHPVTPEDERVALTQIVAEADAGASAALAQKHATRRATKPHKASPGSRTRRRRVSKEPAAAEAETESTLTKPADTTHSSKASPPVKTRRRAMARQKVEAFLAKAREAEKKPAGGIDVNRMTVVELRAALKARGLKRTGLKKDLVERLKGALDD